MQWMSIQSHDIEHFNFIKSHRRKIAGTIWGEPGTYNVVRSLSEIRIQK